MKVKRHKKVKRIILFYRMNLGFVPPFKVIVDGTFAKAALEFKLNIKEQLPRYVDQEVELYTTKCCLWECESFGPLLYGTVQVLKGFSIWDCGHETPLQPDTGSSCLKSCVKSKNKNKLFLATKDPALTTWVRQRGHTPLLYISFNCITLDDPSVSARNTVKHDLQQRLGPVQPRVEKEVKKKRKKKSPNPLSVMKKKKKSASVTTPSGAVLKTGPSSTVHKKQRKKKIRLAPHVREELQKRAASARSAVS